MQSIGKSSSFPVWQLGCKQPREIQHFQQCSAPCCVPIDNKQGRIMQKRGLTFGFSRPLPVSEDQHFNHLPLSFALAFYHVIMWKHILQSWSLSEMTGTTESLQLLRIHWSFSKLSCSSSEHWCAFCGFGQLDTVCSMLLFTTNISCYPVQVWSNIFFLIVVVKYIETHCKHAQIFKETFLSYKNTNFIFSA